MTSSATARPAQAQASPPVRWNIYLQGAVASMSAAFEISATKVARHDIVLRLSTRGEPFHVDVGSYKGEVSAVVVPPMQSHSVRGSGPGFITYFLHLIHPRFRTARNFLNGEPKILDHARFAPLAQRMEDACAGRLSLDEACELMDSVLNALLEGVPPAPPLDMRIPQVMRRLDLNIDHPFEDLAAELGLSASRLSHLFSEQLGLSFRSYQAWARLRQAWEMLAQRPEMSIGDVAQALGFADAAHLSRSFHTGLEMTPTTLRESRAMRVLGQGLPPGFHIPTDAELSKP